MNSWKSWPVALAVSGLIHAAALYSTATLLTAAPRPHQLDIEFDAEAEFASDLAPEVAESAETAAQIEETSSAQQVGNETAVAEPINEQATPVSGAENAQASATTVEADGADSQLATRAEPEPLASVGGTPIAEDINDGAQSITSLASESATDAEAVPQAEQLEDAVQLPAATASTDSTPVNSDTSPDVSAPDEPAGVPVPSGSVTTATVPEAADVAQAAANDAPSAPVEEVATTAVEVAPAPPPTEIATAMLTPPPPAPPRKDSTPAITAFFKSDRGGSCLLVTPKAIRPDGAEAQSVGADAAAFADLQTQFEAEVAAPLELDAALIDKLQCSALDLVKALLLPEASILSIDLEKRDLLNGDTLAAVITGAGSRALRVFIVDDEGFITDVTRIAVADGSDFSLRLRLRISGKGSGKTQLLIALAASQPLKMLDFKGRQQADKILPLVIGEKKVTKIATDAAYAVFTLR